MMRFFKRKMRQGLPISTPGFMTGLQRLAEAFERMTCTHGHIEWSNGHIPRICIDPVMITGTSFAFTPKTFFPVQDGEGTITLIRCHYQRGSNFIETAYEPTVSIETGIIYAVVNTATGEITAQIDYEFDPANPELLGFALYKITASGDSQTATIDYETGVRVLVAYE